MTMDLADTVQPSAVLDFYPISWSKKKKKKKKQDSQIDYESDERALLA